MTDRSSAQTHELPDPAEARASLAAAEEARTTSARANTLPLSAGLLASGSAMTCGSLVVAADAEAGGSPMFVLRILLSLALLIPGGVIYSAARSWARRDTALLVTVLLLQVGAYIAAAMTANLLAMPLYADLAAGFIILVTTVAMVVQRRHA
ncbi:hypothetical protein [Brevibacterium otitidis]|uniref:Integral membrane protein n=1 Tax=Brevibacterium otitidis TaxID=53364 RepID=A0ABV5X0L9_9MICO|nr:hypothetical protein GCM10023233_24300 [Brevibacterium otitidis]